MKDTEKLVKEFFELLEDPKTLIEKAKEFMTITQQEECKTVGGLPVDGSIMGIHQTLVRYKVTSIKEKKSNNKLIKDCIVKMEHRGEGQGEQRRKYLIRLVKEVAPRKAREEGVWGINVNSFRPFK
jgi:hypothetical protein